ncbi:MAG: hypothetical protein R6U86_03695 [Bacteroidales bacterium]
MNRFGLFLLVLTGMIVFSCNKGDEDNRSERFRLLTGAVWLSDSLLVNGEDAGGPGQMLGNFRGEARFKEDGTGTFGQYTGTWSFGAAETEIVILTDSLVFALTTKIAELTRTSLKVTTSFPNFEFPDQPYDIRMTFKAK